MGSTTITGLDMNWWIGLRPIFVCLKTAMVAQSEGVDIIFMAMQCTCLTAKCIYIIMMPDGHCHIYQSTIYCMGAFIQQL